MQHLHVTEAFAGSVPLRIHEPRDTSRAPRAGAVLLYHGLRSSKVSLEDEAHFLATKGLTSVLVDAPHHGARHSRVVADMPNALELPGHYVLLRLVREARDEVPGLVDHLRARGHREVAIAGVSFGAFVALAAATIEPRLAAVASLLGSPDWAPREGPVPEDLEHVVAESPLARHAAFMPRPVLLLNGARDENVRPAGARALAAKLQPLYASSGAGPLEHVEYETATHFPSAAVWRDMWSRTARFLVDAFASRGRPTAHAEAR